MMQVGNVGSASFTLFTKGLGIKVDRTTKVKPSTRKAKLDGVRRASSNTNGNRLLSTYLNAPVGIAECSLDGMYISANEEFCRITGFEKKEVLTRSIKDISYQEDYESEM